MRERVLPLCVLLLSLSVEISNGRTTESPCATECREKKLDIGLIIDSSSSIHPEDFKVGLWFLQDLVNAFKIGPNEVRMAAVTFGDRVYTEDSFGFETYTDGSSLASAIVSLPFQGGPATETGEALKDMRTRLLPRARPGVKRVVIVLTDGNSQDGEKTKREAQAVRDEDVEIFVIGVGNVTLEELENIAGNENNVDTVANYGLLRNILQRLAYRICGGPLPVPTPDPCLDTKVDMAFVIDSSSSIGNADFALGLEFIHKFVSIYNVSPDKVRVAAVTFDEKANEDDAFGFSDYQTEVDVINAIKNMPYRKRRYTNTGDGIRFLREELMPKVRPDAAHLAIVFTDGQSQNWMNTYKQAELAQQLNVGMFAIGVGSDISKEELEKIAGRQDHVFYAKDYSALNALQSTLAYRICGAAIAQAGRRRP